MLTNPDRPKQIKEFVDKDHPVMHEYYRLLETGPDASSLKKELWRLIDQDPLFFDPYLALAKILLEEGKPRIAHGLIHGAYERAIPLIADKEGNWPRKMEWGVLENRHILRAITQYAHLLWEEGKLEEALDVCRRLLKMSPSDNLGIRFVILAIRLRLGPKSEDAFGMADLAGQTMDATKVNDWFERNARKFPAEFDWLIKKWKSMGFYFLQRKQPSTYIKVESGRLWTWLQKRKDDWRSAWCEPGAK